MVKRADAGGAPSLQREGERLAQASHPGVVQVLGSGPADGGWELRTAHAGRPLSIVEPLTVPQAAGVVASLASTLADLHQMGVVHGRIDGSHVLVGEHGRPVLCGFGEGTEAAPVDDIAALGALLVTLLGGHVDEAEPIPDHRWRRPRGWTGWERRALLLLADQACAEPATRRPSARRLAAAIVETVPALGSPSMAAATDGGPAHAIEAAVDPMGSLRASMLVDVGERAARPSAVVLGVLGLLLLAAGFVRLREGEADPTAAHEAASGSAVSTATTAVPSSDTRTAAPVAGSLIEVGGRQYRVGQAGDELLVEDWDCDGTPTPALLRPSTGEVYIFPRWIDHDQVAVEPVLQVPDAEALVSAGRADACPTLSVRAGSGELVPVLEGSS